MENFFIYTIWPLHEAGSSWQDGGCATHNPILAKAKGHKTKAKKRGKQEKKKKRKESEEEKERKQPRDTLAFQRQMAGMAKRAKTAAGAPPGNG